MELIVAFLLGWFASFVASAVYDLGKRPALEISVGENVDGQVQSGSNYRLTHIMITNKPASWPWRIVTDRQVAYGCEAVMEVFDLKRGDKAIEDGVVGRWSGTPEPVQDLPVNVPSTGESIVIKWPDAQKLPIGRKLDLLPGRIEPMPTAIKFDGQVESYMFSNESYFHRLLLQLL